MKHWPKALVCFVVWGLFWAAAYVIGFMQYAIDFLMGTNKRIPDIRLLFFCFLLTSLIIVPLAILVWETMESVDRQRQEKWDSEQAEK